MIVSMAISPNGKSLEIRALASEGLTSRQIIERGYARSTVFNALRAKGRQRSLRSLLEDVLSLETEILELLRGASGGDMGGSGGVV